MGERYDRRLLLKVLDGLGDHDRLSVVTVGTEGLDEWKRNVIHQYFERVLRQCIAGESPDLGVFPGIALTNVTPRDDFRWRVFARAKRDADELPIALGPDAPGDVFTETILQVVVGDSYAYPRYNGAAHGVLWVIARPDWLDVGWELPADERRKVTHLTVLTGHIGDEPAALVFWDIGPSIIRGSSKDDLIRKMRRSLGTSGARARWGKVEDRLQRDGTEEEIRSAYYEAYASGTHPVAIGSSILDQLDDRKTQAIPVSALPESFEAVDIDAPDPLEAAIEDDDEARVSDALSTLPEREREIVDRYFAHGQSDAQIGRALGVSQQAVNKQRRKAIERLRNFFL